MSPIVNSSTSFSNLPRSRPSSSSFPRTPLVVSIPRRFPRHKSFDRVIVNPALNVPKTLDSPTSCVGIGVVSVSSVSSTCTDRSIKHAGFFCEQTLLFLIRRFAKTSFECDEPDENRSRVSSGGIVG